MRYNDRSIRHELKYEIDEARAFLLRKTLLSTVHPDPNMPSENGYLITSIYFDDVSSRALQEKLSGIDRRRKFRIRSYDLNDKLIRLECKEKYGEYIAKLSAWLTRAEYDRILAGDYEVLKDRSEEVCKSLYILSKTKLIHPVVVVEYLREAYIFPTGNVRITFDKEISASSGTLDMFSKEYITRRVMPHGRMILEVKYDDFLPGFIRKCVCVADATLCSASKYVMCRIEKNEVGFI